MSRTVWSRRQAAAVAVCLLLLTGCKRRDRKIRVQQTEEDTVSMASMIHMSDTRAAPQLLKGFYSIEEKSWRWTMGQFSVALRPPRNAALNGATLHFKFTLPEAVLAKVKTVSLSASINGKALSPETYTQAGEFDYSRDVDAKLLTGEGVTVDFTLDKFLPAGMVETRELGVIATSVGFEVK
jgi:hypothetical protein